jgi:hypothetical protein
MMAKAPSNSYASSGTLTHPGAAPGDEVVLRASGAEVSAFEIFTQGVSAMVPNQAGILVAPASPVDVTWQTDSDPGLGKVFLVLNINNHGSNSAWIECEAPDSGSFEIPAELVDELMNLGFSGYPTVTFTRRVVNSVALDSGCVEFAVMSEVVLDAPVEGLTSCSVDEDCTEPGEVCREDLSCG